ncbi:MAG: hypothetical protein AAF581_06755 [Planctomycetota bacterium]
MTAPNIFRTCRIQKSHQRQRGAVLVLAMMMMTMTMAFGLAYLSATDFELECSFVDVERLQAEALAESAADLAYARLVSGSFAPETNIGLGLGSYSYTVKAAAGGYDLQAVATVGRVTMTCESRIATPETDRGYSTPFYIFGDVNGDLGTLTWDEDLLYGNGLSLTGSGSSRFLADLTAVDIDPTQYTRTQTAAAGDHITGTHSDQLYVDGDLFLDESVNLTGTILTTGSLVINGKDADVTLDSGTEKGLLYVLGDLELTNIGNLTLRGSIFVEGNLIMDSIANIDAISTLVVNGTSDFQLASTSGAWLLDASVARDLPPPIIDAPVTIISHKPVWRRVRAGN